MASSLDLTTGIVYLKGTAILSVGSGTISAPSLAFSAEAGLGFYRSGTGEIAVANGNVAGTNPFVFTPSTFRLGNAEIVGWSSATAAASAAADVGISRLAAASLGVGNGTAGDTSGTMQATTLYAISALKTGNGNTILLGAADGNLGITNSANTIGSRIKADALPTVSSGFGTSPSITAGSTPFAGSVNVGTGGVATSGVINFNGTAFPSAPYVIVTTSLTNAVCRATATTTQLTITSTTAWTASDVISWHCVSAK